MKLYAAATPNARRAAIALEELGIAYDIVPVDIMAGGQFSDDFRRLSPLAKIPVLVDPQTGARLYGSAAVVMYLADKSGKLLPKEPAVRAEALEWFMLAASDLSPTSSVLYVTDFLLPEKQQPTRDFFAAEFARIVGAMDKRLTGRDYLAGEYSIADIQAYPYIDAPLAEPIIGDGHPNLRAWMARMAARPAVQRGMKAPG